MLNFDGVFNVINSEIWGYNENEKLVFILFEFRLILLDHITNIGVGIQFLLPKAMSNTNIYILYSKMCYSHRMESLNTIFPLIQYRSKL